MIIWLINNYNMLPEHGHLNRNYYFGKNLKEMGHEPIAFAGSHPHNTELQLITGQEKYRIYQKEPFPWVLIKTRNYEGSKKSRILSMFEFYRNMKAASKDFERPDAIIGSSAHPLAALLAIKLGKKYKCRKIVEIRDLWPESIVAYGVAKASNPIIKALRRFEKWIYMHADSIIFTMEGAYDYIVDQGWEKDIPRSKVHYINNGVDLDLFENNRKQFPTADEDLEDRDSFKVIYTGSIRKANGIGILSEAAKELKDQKIKILVWGTGDELEELKKRKNEENIDDIVYKGAAKKQEIPYILSKGDLLFLDPFDDTISKYGISSNKLFEYFAAGKPVLTNCCAKNDPAQKYGCGIVYELSASGISQAIQKVKNLDEEKYSTLCRNALKAAQDYSYRSLAEKMISLAEAKEEGTKE